MPYTVRQLAKLAGVTPRTLRFYDRQGLLSPAKVGKNGYRYYGENELIRLQQILFFRELDYPLVEIKRMMGPGFDVVESLGYQKRLLELKKKRLSKIIRTIDDTIIHMRNDTKPTDADIYGAFSTEEIEAYKKEAEERWGHTEAYKVSAARAAKLTKEDWKRMHEEADALMRRLTDLLVAGKTPDSPEVQAEIAKHHAGIEVFYPCSMEMYRGLGDMYLADERYSDQYRVFHKDLPEFIVKGMHAFCDARTGK